MEKELFKGMGRGHMLALLLAVGFGVLMVTLALTDAPMGNVQKWAEVYTTFSLSLLAVVVVPKELTKIATKFSKKKETE